MLAGIVDLAAERGSEVSVVAGGVGDDVVAPVVEGAAMRIGEAEGDVGIELSRERLVAIDGAVDVAHGTGDRLDLRTVENAVAKQNRAARLVDERVGGVVRIGGVETHKHALREHTLAADIAHEPDVGAPA